MGRRGKAIKGRVDVVKKGNGRMRRRGNVQMKREMDGGGSGPSRTVKA